MHKLRSIILALLLSSASLIAMAQESATISGCVVNAEGQPLLFTNVVVLSLPDSSLLAGCTVEHDGCFTLGGIPFGEALLRLSVADAEPSYQHLALSSTDTLKLGQLTLAAKANTLDEATVTAASYPQLRVDRGMLVLNVQGTALSNVGSAGNVLERTPLVVSSNTDRGSYSVVGRGAATVYIDDRKMRDPTELEQLDARNVISVQVITNPGAKYDAGVVINVVTNKKREDGLSLYTDVGARQATYLTPYGQTSASYTKGKLTLLAGYYVSGTKNYMEESNRTTTMGDTLWNMQASNTGRSGNLAQQLNGGFVFYPNKSQTLGARYWLYLWDANEKTLNSGYTMTANGTPYASSTNGGSNKFDYHQDRVQAYYYAQLGARLQLKFDGDYIANKANSTDIMEENTGATQPIETNMQSESKYSIWAGQLQLEAKLAENQTLTAGVRSSITDGNGGNAYTGNPIPSNGYTTNESRYAGFASYGLQLSRLTFEAGMRYQVMSGKTTENDITKADKSYKGWLPFLSASYMVSENLGMNLNLSSDMTSPPFDQLNSDIRYVNQFRIGVGNPYLQPAYSYTATYSLSYKAFTTQLYYAQTNNHLMQTLSSLPQKEEVLVVGNTNADKYRQLGASLTFSKQIKVWQPQYTANLSQPFFSLSSAQYGRQTYNNPIFSIYLRNMFMLPKGWMFAVDGYFSTGGNTETTLVDPFGSLNCWVQKELMNRQLTVRVFLQDILRTSDPTYKASQNNVTYSKTGGYNDGQMVGINITWRFNNYRDKYRGQGAAKSEAERLPSKAKE